MDFVTIPTAQSPRLGLSPLVYVAAAAAPASPLPEALASVAAVASAFKVLLAVEEPLAEVAGHVSVIVSRLGLKPDSPALVCAVTFARRFASLALDAPVPADAHADADTDAHADQLSPQQWREATSAALTLGYRLVARRAKKDLEVARAIELGPCVESLKKLLAAFISADQDALVSLHVDRQVFNTERAALAAVAALVAPAIPFAVKPMAAPACAERPMARTSTVQAVLALESARTSRPHHLYVRHPPGSAERARDLTAASGLQLPSRLRRASVCAINLA
jgi:hypothetical protein